MIKDPLTKWPGQFPYDVLAPAGVTPETTHKDMSAVSFKLMARRMMTQRARLAWDELRMIQRRMLVDFMLYDIDLTAEIAAARQAAERELADAGEPPADQQAFALHPELLHELLEELRTGLTETVPEPPVPDGADALAALLPPAWLDELIGFDR